MGQLVNTLTWFIKSNPHILKLKWNSETKIHVKMKRGFCKSMQINKGKMNIKPTMPHNRSSSTYCFTNRQWLLPFVC